MSKKAKKVLIFIQGLVVINVLLFAVCVFLTVKAIGYQKENAKLRQANEDLMVSLNDAEGELPDVVSASINADGEMQLKEMPEDGPDIELKTHYDPETLAVIQAYAESGKSFIATLKALFPEQFVVADEGRFHFVNIDPALRPYSYDDSRIALSPEGIITYDDDTAHVSYGIDVSQHNDEIDWEALSESSEKPDFIYVRAGIRGYGSGKLVADTQVSANLIGARECGAQVGVYFVTQAVNEEEAREEAQFVLETIGDNPVDLPMVLDVEKVENFDTEPRTRGLSAEEYTRNVLAFVDEMKKEGYETMIYGNGKTFMLMLDMSKLEDVDKWFADYVAEDDYVPYFPYDFSIWQFSSQGHVAGINGDVDLNIRFEDD